VTSPDQQDLFDHEEFVRLWSAHRDHLYGFVFSLLPDHVEAEEVFQRASVVLWSKFASFEPGTDFWRWAARVAQLEVLDYRKRKRRERLQFWTEDVIDAIASAHVQYSELLQQQRQALRDCLMKLPSRDRELIVLRYGADRVTTKQLAETLGRPLVTLYKALGRIRRGLYECIQRTLARE
jgi:RNA polymerase sigma-70 factor (ECF subfamily)